MGWFGSKKDENEDLLKRDWNSKNASSVESRPGHLHGTQERHERLDGNYIVERDIFGNVVKVKKA